MWQRFALCAEDFSFRAAAEDNQGCLRKIFEVLSWFVRHLCTVQFNRPDLMGTKGPLLRNAILESDNGQVFENLVSYCKYGTEVPSHHRRTIEDIFLSHGFTSFTYNDLQTKLNDPTLRRPIPGGSAAAASSFRPPLTDDEGQTGPPPTVLPPPPEDWLRKKK